ncbi:hypothetical protein LWI29_024848 [Acer saccharum]|uniref:Uncharacterized protein n=1 Tax=Acer saccharum TaxID=4024 RepID=A0AA39REG9_ACESA|nr:hypothetical protein LWI29_024848 [Acer saccharum]
MRTLTDELYDNLHEVEYSVKGFAGDHPPMIKSDHRYLSFIILGDYCNEDSAAESEDPSVDEEQNLAASNNVSEGVKESYGPWMQVSYGRPNRNHLGNSFTGRKGWNQGNGGKQGLGERQGSKPSVGGNDKNETNEVNRKGAGPFKSILKASPIKKNGKAAVTNMAGSRFAILNENLEEETSVENLQAKASSSKVLTEISNKNLPTKKFLNPIASKYLIDSPVVKSSFNKPCKENGREGWSKKWGKGAKNNNQISTSIQSISMEEDIEDSEVLQNLHKKMVEIRVAEDQQVDVNKHPSSAEMVSSDLGQ